MPQVSLDIEIEGRTCVDVAQNLLNALNVRSVPQKQSGTAVPQVVGGEVRQTVGFHKPLDAAGHSVGGAGLENSRLAEKNEAVRKDGAGFSRFRWAFNIRSRDKVLCIMGMTRALAAVLGVPTTTPLWGV